MKNTSNRIGFILSAISIVAFIYLSSLLHSCKKQEFERVVRIKTGEISYITNNSAQIKGIIQDVGESGITQYGHCWSIISSPATHLETKTERGSRSIAGIYYSNIDGLIAGTTYNVRAYAISEGKTTYGNEVNFTTDSGILTDVPTVVTNIISSISDTSAQSGGNITSDGGATVIARGVCWSISENPSVSDSKTNDGSGAGTFTSIITGLSPITTYHVRAYATNSTGIAYGGDSSFTTIHEITPPNVTTSTISSITETSAQGGGNVIYDGGAEITARGICWDTIKNPTIENNNTNDGTGTGSFISSLSSLLPCKKYYVRAYATNIKGTAYGNQDSLNTIGCIEVVPPTVIIDSIAQITYNSVLLYGTVSDNGNGQILNRGVCWSTSENPTIDDYQIFAGSSSMGSFEIYISGLVTYTTYYVRAFATNINSTSYSEQDTFKTRWDNSSITDFDGNEYSTIQIGEQVWMAENLKSTHYANGTSITLVEDNSAWSALTETNKAYCYYDNSTSNGEIYGALYTWAAIMNGVTSSDANPSGVRGICPTNWHLPSDDEWKELEKHLGMSLEEADNIGWRGIDEGSKLKTTSGWYSGGNGSNVSGFSVLPSGVRYSSGYFVGSGESTTFWSSMEYNSSNAWFRGMSYDYEGVYRGGDGGPKDGGLSVRCIRD